MREAYLDIFKYLVRARCVGYNFLARELLRTARRAASVALKRDAVIAQWGDGALVAVFCLGQDRCMLTYGNPAGEVSVTDGEVNVLKSGVGSRDDLRRLHTMARYAGRYKNR